VAVTLAEIMADSGHYSIDSTAVRAHVSAAGGKGGLINALLAARLPWLSITPVDGDASRPVASRAAMSSVWLIDRHSPISR
jgi:hypothetical protein